MVITRAEVHCFNKTHESFHVLDAACFRSKNLHNKANYYIRRVYIFSSRLARDIPLNDDGQQCIAEINKVVDDYNIFKKDQCKKSGKTFSKHPYFGKCLKTIGYDFLNFFLKTTDEYKALNAQVAQQTLMLVIKNWVSYHQSIQEWIKEPEKFTGKPGMPYYKDKTTGRFTVTVTNQVFSKEGSVICFSKNLNNVQINTTIDAPCQVRINPKGSFYTVDVVYKKTVPKLIKTTNILGIDLGVNNLVTMVNNIGLQPVVVKGEVIKSYNQYYNKRTAHYTSILEAETGRKTSNMLETINRKRYWFIKNFMHKTICFIVDYCVEHNIDTIVIGKNNQWKTNINLGSVTNQKFVYIPYNLLIDQIKYKARDAGIRVKINEEAYTSKASFLDSDEIPKYDKNSDKPKFSGRRKHRGLYKSADGTLINADVNGAYNIIRKVFPNAFKRNGIEGVGRHPIKVNVLS